MSDSHAARSVEEKAATSKLMSDSHAARSVEEKAAASKLMSDSQKAIHAARSMEEKAATSKLMSDSHAARSVEEKAATSKLMSDSHAARSVEEKAATSKLKKDNEQQRLKTLMQYCTMSYAVVEVGTGLLLLDGLNMAAIKEIFDLPHALHTNQFHVVRTYDMRNCYVANTAPNAKYNKCVLGEKKSLKDLSNDGKQVNTRLKAPKAFLTNEEKAKRRRQSTSECTARRKQRTQEDAAA